MLRAHRAAGVVAGAIALSGARGADAQSRPAVPSRPPARWAAFTSAFDGYAGADGVVGGSVVVLRAGRVLARHAYGRGDLRAPGRPAEDAVYHWASITKTLTAIAILQLRDRGRLTLDDPIVR